MFSLSFNVTNRSPTIVTCSVDNGNQFNVSDNDLIRTITPVNNDVQVEVSVIFRMRVSGLYKCFVTTDRIKATPLVSTNMTMRNVTCKYPSHLTYSTDNLLSVTLGWSSSAVISATPQYHVNNSNGMNDDTTNTASTDSTLSVPLISAIVSVLVIVVALVLITVCAICVIVCRKKLKNYNIDQSQG